MTLYLIRHAEADNATDKLTAKGRQEAKLLADRLEKLNIDEILVSPMNRAKETASLLLSRLGIDAEEKDWLQEFAPRRWDPSFLRTRPIWDQVPAQWSGIKDYYDRDEWCHTADMEHSGVSKAYKDVCVGFACYLARNGYLYKGNHQFSARHPNRDSLVLFTHFGTECLLLSFLLGISPMVLWHGTCALTSSVTTLVTEEREERTAVFRMIGFSDISHLYAADTPPSFSGRFCETYDCFDERHN